MTTPTTSSEAELITTTTTTTPTSQTIVPSSLGATVESSLEGSEKEVERSREVGSIMNGDEATSEHESTTGNEEKSSPSTPESSSLAKDSGDEANSGSHQSTDTASVSAESSSSDKEKESEKNEVKEKEKVKTTNQPCEYDLVEDNDDEEEVVKKRWPSKGSTSLAISNVNDRERAEENESAQSMRSPRSLISGIPLFNPSTYKILLFHLSSRFISSTDSISC